MFRVFRLLMLTPIILFFLPFVSLYAILDATSFKDWIKRIVQFYGF